MARSGRQATQLDSARGHLARGDLAAAEKVCRHFLRQRPRDLGGLCLLASVLAQTGRIEEALRTLSRVIENFQTVPDGYVEMARLYARSGRLREALQVLQQAEERITDGLGTVLVEQAKVLGALGRQDEAQALLQQAITTEPGNVECWRLLGTNALNAGNAGAAVDALDRAVAIDSSNVDSLCLSGHALRMAERLDDARARFEQALTRDPTCEEAIGGLAEILQSLREYEAAHTMLARAIEDGSNHPGVVLAFARWCQWAKEYDAGIHVVQRCLDQSAPVGPQQRLMLLFAAGGLYEAKADYERAFRCLRAANDLYPKRFNRREHVRSTDRMMAAFSSEMLAQRRGQCGCDDSCPVFILGMPRSGTSLVEQVIASHPQAAGCGELTFLHEILNEVRAGLAAGQEYPDCIEGLSDEALTSMGQEYAQRLRALAGRRVLRATDKLPTNYYHVGLINLILPNARIIHCERHPMDTCFSIYATQLSPLYAYANDQRDLALAYCEYHRLMEHWKSVSQIPILSIRYEDMVDDLEVHARRIIEYVGLNWDDSCLRFHEARRVVGTASEDQVRRPIYRSSVERYQHYEKHLGRLREELGALVGQYEGRGISGE